MAGSTIDVSTEEKVREQKKKLLRRALADDDGVPKKLSPMAQKKLLARKKVFRQRVGLGVLGLFALLIYWGFKPFKTGLNYGVCKVFIELSVPYPDTIHYSEVIDFIDSTRIWYSYYDSFGDFRLQQTQCYFKPDERFGLALSRVTIGRIEVDPAKVEQFNLSLPAIFAHPPDLTYPTPLPNDISALKFEIEKFRKSIF